MAIRWNEPQTQGLAALSLEETDLYYTELSQVAGTLELSGDYRWLCFDNRGHHRFVVTLHSQTGSNPSPTFMLHAWDRLEVDVEYAEPVQIIITDQSLPVPPAVGALQIAAPYFGMVSITAANRRLRLLSYKAKERVVLDQQGAIAQLVGYSATYDTLGLSALAVRAVNNAGDTPATLIVERLASINAGWDQLLSAPVPVGQTYNTDIGPGLRTPADLGVSVRLRLPVWGAGASLNSGIFVTGW